MAQITCICLDDEHQKRTPRITREGRDFLHGLFAELDLEFVLGTANFVLVRVGDAPFDFVLRKRVKLRVMRAYRLPPHCEWLARPAA